MTGPLVVLGILSIAGGFVGLPAWLGANRFFHFLEPSLALAAIRNLKSSLILPNSYLQRCQLPLR